MMINLDSPAGKDLGNAAYTLAAMRREGSPGIFHVKKNDVTTIHKGCRDHRQDTSTH